MKINNKDARHAYSIVVYEVPLERDHFFNFVEILLIRPTISKYLFAYFLYSTGRYNSLSIDLDRKMTNDVSAKENYSWEPWYGILSYVLAVFSTIQCILAAFFIFVIFKKRQFTFNLYLIFVIAPDVLLSAVYGVASFYEGAHDGVYADGLCVTRLAFSVFYYYANLYMYAAIAREVHILIMNSYRREKTAPPTIRRVLTQVAIVYTFAAWMAFWISAPYRWSPNTVKDETYCIVSSGSPTSDPVFTLATGVLVSFVLLTPPFGYVFWVSYQVKKRKLLPMKGRTRALSLYFFRISLVFVAFYMPASLMLFLYTVLALEGTTAGFILQNACMLMTPLQIMMTLRILLQKDDLAEAMKYTISTLSMKLSSFMTIKGEESEWNQEDVHDSLAMETVQDESDYARGGNMCKATKTSNMDPSIEFFTTSRAISDRGTDKVVTGNPEKLDAHVLVITER